MATLMEAAKTNYSGPYDVKITDGSVSYERDNQLEAFVDSLAQQEPEDLGEGVEWYSLSDGIDDDSKDSKGLLTRKDSRGVVDAVLQRAIDCAEKGRGSMSFIVGSPGIGKTRTLTYALRQLLQQENINVQYFSQKENSASLFLRRKGKTFAFKATVQIQPMAGGALFSSKLSIDAIRTYILLDPRETGASFSYPSLSHLIVSCSANIKHFHNLRKEKRTSMFYLGLPSVAELEKMSPKLGPNLDQKVLLSRISDVGPVPRYVFCDEKTFDDRKREISRKAQGEKQSIGQQLILAALTDGDVLTESPTICGALFAHVNVKTNNEVDGAEGTDYEEQRISLLSQLAAWSVYRKFRSTLVQATVDGQHCDTRAVFEKLCAFDLIVGGNFHAVTMTPAEQQRFQIRLKPASRYVKKILPAESVVRVFPSRREGETREFFVRPALAGNSNIETECSSYEPPPAKKQRLGPPFIVLSDGYSGIDFLNTDRQVFQATVGTDHDMKGWANLLIDAEILLHDKETNRLKHNSKAKALEFYWVVPQHQANWATRKAKRITSKDIPKVFEQDKDVIDMAIKKHVRQFVLFIDKEQPQQSEFWSTYSPLHGGGDRCALM